MSKTIMGVHIFNQPIGTCEGGGGGGSGGGGSGHGGGGGFRPHLSGAPLAERSLRTSTRRRSEHALPRGVMIVLTRKSVCRFNVG
jgi:hypothetical protein